MPQNLSLATRTRFSRSPLFLAAIAVLTLMPIAARGETASATMQVSATVKAVARLEAANFPSRLEITAADIARGYVETIVPVVYRTNDPRGVMIRMSLESDAFSNAAVRWETAEIRVSGPEAYILQPFSGLGSRTLQMVCRLNLSERATPATYAWPLAMSISPVQQW